MTAPAHEPALDALEFAARELRARHTALQPTSVPLPAREEIDALPGWLASARTLLADPEPGAAKAAEWLLDNDYQVLRAERQISEDLTDGFYGRLPGLASETDHGLPRAFVLAHGLLSATHMQISYAAAVRFVRSYQEDGAWLTIAELWAFPALLRLACLELLVTALARVVPELEPPFPATPAACGPTPLEDTECVARALSNLGVIASISWKDFFEATSRVEAMLQSDPAGAYGQMDFETRDRYRKAVETLARRSDQSEAEVARRVVEHARHFLPATSRRAHVGEWLLGEGSAAFERELKCRLPRAEVLRRWILRRAGPLYGAVLALATMAAVAAPAAYLAAAEAAPLDWLLGLAFAVLPASVVGVTVAHWLATRAVSPRVLPKLDFEKGIPAEFATAVVVPALVASPAEARELVERLESHYLANPDPTLRFALLTDPLEGPSERMAGDEAIERALVEEIRRSNARQRPAPDAPGPFHVLHRHRRFNPAEGCWMGWERKRGKLEQFNQLLAGAADAGFAFHEGDAEALRGVRFVVTADVDTRLPPGSVARLAGTLAHPLNRPEFDERTATVRAGYTVVQPRVEISPESGSRSLFARLYSGDTAIDIYTCAVSDVYMDLFGTGIYIGKGIYDAEAFARSLAGRVPENRLASHDLFEGVHGRAALASDVVLYESFPSGYEEFARRWHRWVRGDWQLVPWLAREVPGADGERLPNRLSVLGRWQILDNLRRSLMPASLIALLAAGWLVLPGSPWFWTAIALASPVAYLFADLLTGLARGRRRGAVRGIVRRLADHGGRWLLAVVFLPQDTALSLDAAARTLWRVYVTRRHLLEWTSAAHVAARFERSSRLRVWRRLWVGPASALVLGAVVALLHPVAFPSAAPLLLLWLASPEIALATGRRIRRGPDALDPEAVAFLRRLARRTWLFFETFAGSEDHWLPPDNFQEQPHAEVAHRTSPTNVGMLLLSSLSAFDLGYLGVAELAARLRSCLDTLYGLERDRGHLFNWYDTRSLLPLEPRYISTVDSGNLAVSLVALKEGCRELAAGPPLRREAWDGLADVLALLKAALSGLEAGAPVEALRAHVELLAAEAAAARGDPATWRAAWSALGEVGLPELDRLVIRAFDAAAPPMTALREIRTWLERAHHHVRGALLQTAQHAPWQALLEQPPGGCEELARSLGGLLTPGLRLADATERCIRARALLSESPLAQSPEAPLRAYWSALGDAVDQGEAAARELRETLRDIAARAEALAFGMDFRMLYDAETRRFRIGYNASADRHDAHHYDLLATEARLASFFAIAKGDVPTEHWFHLGRPITETSGSIALLSWGGSLFEYLMPPLLLRSHPGTLLFQSERTAIDAQRRFSREFDIPWGVSESGFASLDPHGHYRYLAFGVPSLGIRRGLARDRVIAPYASALALPVRTHAAVANLRELEQLGMCGLYGMREAADFTPDRAPRNGARRFTPVRSWMAHHQGMTLAALGNTLCGEALVRRFHSDRRVRAVELLLHERVPRELPTEAGRAHERAEPPARRAAVPPPGPWTPAGPDSAPRVHALGNGRLSCWISDSGAGALHWHGRALTRWLPDTTRDDRGLWIYVRDEESGAIWSAGRQPTGARADESHVVFHPHMAEFHRRDQGIALRLEVAVAPADDLEIRRLGIANETDRPRSLTLTSFAEVALAAPLEDERHPAFSKLFVGGEWLPELRGLLFGRRPRHPSEKPPVLLHWVVSDVPFPEPGFEVDRGAFLGRHGDPRRPRGVVEGLSGSSGFTLDPILALQVEVALEPGERRELCFVTLAAGSRESALELAERYATPAALDWAIADAAGETARSVQRLGLEPHRLPELQALASLLLHPHSALRGPRSSLAGNRLGQPRLWGLGLSGDLPILLLRAGDPGEGTLLPALVRGHELWQRHGFDVDLVVLRTGASAYAEPLREQLFALLRDAGAHGPLGRRGGVHLLFADQIQSEELRLLEAVAAVVLDEARGPLAQQLAGAGPRYAELPAFEVVGPPAPHVPAPPVARPTDLLFDNGFGGFTPDGREYVIQLGPGESTPAAWCNVLANEGFGCLTSESGLGFSWAENSGENRLTPWSNDPLLDPPGEVLYLRDEETAEIWTPTPQPVGDAAICQVRHGAGYTAWRKTSHGFEQELLVFVPSDEPVKIARLRLRNLAPRSRRVTATYYAEWLLGALRSVAGPHVVSEWQPDGPALFARSAWNPDFAGRIAFLTATRPPHGLTTDRREFLGREGDPRRPAALLRWGLSDRVESGADPCAAYQVHLDVGPEDTVEVSFALGQGRDREHTQQLVQRWRDTDRIERAWQELGPHWDRLLGAVEVRTPERSFDLMLNRWLLYQTIASRLLARAGFHQAGGAFGFRDQLQDMLALLHVDPARVRSHLLVCAAHQFEEGDVLHWWHPPSDRGVRTRCSDDLLWLAWVTSAYVEATGDESILDEQAPFLRAPPLAADEETRYSRFEVAPERRSLLEHCERALERGVTRGAHGLPLIGSGDWNDGMDRVGAHGRGESVWLAWFAISTMRRFAALCDLRARDDLAGRWRRGAEELARAVEAAGWDGEWYLRAFDDDGRPWGSHSCDEARIDSIAQSWSVLSGAGDPERASRALAAAERELVREEDGVIRLLWPPFDQTRRDPGYIKAYPPGVRENGGQYSHAAAWLGFAFTARGEGARAARAFALLNPVARTTKRADAERHRGEPYVLAADIGSIAPHVGRGGWTWYTGAAGWTWRLGVEGILGLRRRGGRVVVAPCLPPGWPGFEATLRGPAGVLSIRVEVAAELEAGRCEVRCEGAPVGEEGVAFPTDGSTRHVEVSVGRSLEGSA